MPAWTIRKSIAAGALALACVGTAAVTAASDSGPLNSERPEPERPIQSSASPAAVASFSVLSQPSARTSARGKLDERVVKSLGLQAGTVALSSRSSRGTEILLGPGSGGICTIVKDSQFASGGCSSEQDAAEGRVIGARGCAQTGLLLYGVVPDGVSRVTARLRDGSTADIPVTNNSYQYAVPVGSTNVPETVTIPLAAGAVKRPASFPRDLDC